MFCAVRFASIVIFTSSMLGTIVVNAINLSPLAFSSFS